MKVVLASQSPRRAKLLKEVFENFEICPSNEEETCQISNPAILVSTLALKKAKAVATCNAKCLVVGADTVVAFEDKILEKPKDAENARKMLMMLSGKKHEVWTGVALVLDDTAEVFCEKSQVFFKTITSAQIEEYIATGSPFDKAGAYGIQDCNFVEKVEGSVANVVGLPVEKMKEVLAQWRRNGKL